MVFSTPWPPMLDASKADRLVFRTGARPYGGSPGLPLGTEFRDSHLRYWVVSIHPYHLFTKQASPHTTAPALDLQPTSAARERVCVEVDRDREKPTENADPYRLLRRVALLGAVRLSALLLLSTCVVRPCARKRGRFTRIGREDTLAD